MLHHVSYACTVNKSDCIATGGLLCAVNPNPNFLQLQEQKQLAGGRGLLFQEVIYVHTFPGKQQLGRENSSSRKRSSIYEYTFNRKTATVVYISRGVSIHWTGLLA